MLASDAIVINYYGPSTAVLTAPDGTLVTLKQSTTYPIAGAVEITVTPSRPALFTIRLKIPAWSRASTVVINSDSQTCTAGAYCELHRIWRPGDLITLTLDMNIRAVRGEANARGRAAATISPIAREIGVAARR